MVWQFVENQSKGGEGSRTPIYSLSTISAGERIAALPPHLIISHRNETYKFELFCLNKLINNELEIFDYLNSLK